MRKYINYVSKSLDEQELMEGLAEEAAEVSQAALKLIRAKGWSRNATPVTAQDAQANLDEELEDLVLVLAVCGYDLHELADSALKNPKAKRWAERLGYPKEGE